MKIMITGGLGFVGSHLAEKFIQQNHELILITQSLSKKENISKIKNEVQIEKFDITNFQKLSNSIERHQPNLIIHLAGQTSHSKSFENPLYDVDSNSKSTLFILEKLKNMNLKCKFILGSTFIVVGRPLKLPVNEQSLCSPTTIYGANRLASEHYCKIYNNVYGLDCVSFRITNSYGPREQVIPNKNAINYLIYKAYKRDNITIYNKGKFFRDLIYISDVVSAIDTIAKKGKSGELYWISSGKKTWFSNLGHILEKITSAKVRYVEAPKYTKKTDVGNFVVDNTKLRSLGWRPKLSLEEGIRNTIEFFKETEM